MDFLDELENLAVGATYQEPEENCIPQDPSKKTIKMWQERFGYTYEQAAELVGIATTVKKPPTTTATLWPAQARMIYALKLEGPISNPQKLQFVANLPTIPRSYHGSGEDGDATFCKVDGRTKRAIENWLATQKETTFRPLFVSEGKAYKELCPCSLYPTLGKDATLPQYRPQDPDHLDKPASFGQAQDHYPVWYFFYGTLADVAKLRSLLSLAESEMPVLQEATIRGGVMKTWGQGKYNALVDGAETSCTKGTAYHVKTEEHEDALRKYETSVYEVVRCLIEMDNRVVQGCTFRFVGEVD